MTLAETTRSRTRRPRSAAEVMASLDILKLVRIGVWVAFCVLLVVLR
jgi:hypothetical protein